MENFSDIVRKADAIVKNLGNRWLKDAWKDEEKISQVLDLLSDKPSRETYAREILWCFLNTFLKGELAATMAGMMTIEQWSKHVHAMYEKGIHSEMEAPTGSQPTLDISRTTTFVLEQYRYKNEVRIEPGDVCLDLGGCFGDTAIWMMDNGAASVFSFEIEPMNLAAMQNNFAQNCLYAGIHPENMAVSDKKGTVFSVTNSYNPGACHITSQRPAGSDYHEIECVTLDSFCSENNIRPTFIKMDIEGAELDAINGGIEVFTNMRPKFAICIYHTRDHRWEIPLRLAQLCPDYNFYVKKSHPVFETVFFGCPREKAAIA